MNFSCVGFLHNLPNFLYSFLNLETTLGYDLKISKSHDAHSPEMEFARALEE